MKILILGVTGMLGHTLFYYFSKNKLYDVYATERGKEDLNKYFSAIMLQKVISNVNADEIQTVQKTIEMINPDLVINCIGIIKQLDAAKDPLISISINSLFPHKLANLCAATNTRLIHISTDCVFSGRKGNYKDNDPSDADDLYGKTKYLGELKYDHCVTIRTSIIGHEINTKFGLVEWFLSQKSKVKGYNKAFFTGFPTIELANIIHKYIIPNQQMNGLYNVSSNKISKYALLNLIADRYSKEIEIEKDNSIIIDRSLDSSRFRKLTGYIPPSWNELVNMMYIDQQKRQGKERTR